MSRFTLSGDIPAVIGTVEDARDFYSQRNQPMPYRPEFNPLSCRWLIIKDDGQCEVAGLSEDAARAGTVYFINHRLHLEARAA